MLKQLKIFFAYFVFITSLHAQNYDESKVPSYTLPDVLKASNIVSVASLKQIKDFIPINKTLLFNMDDLGMYIGNIEGVSFGPKLSNGHSTLIFVADNNFRATEKTQFLLFEIISK